MKFAGAIVLLLAIGACVIAPWLLFPLTAGLLTVVMVLLFVLWNPRRPAPAKIARALKAALVLGAIGFAVWLFWFTPRQPALEAYDANRLNMNIAQWLRISAPTSTPWLDPVQSDRRSFMATLQRERQKIALISGALDLRHTADAEFVRRNTKNLPDEKGLGKALADLKAALERGPTKGESLLNPPELKKHMDAAKAEIDGLEKKGLAEGQDPQKIREEIRAIPYALRAYDLDVLYVAAVALQNALEAALRVNLAPQSTYQSIYDRSTDTLTSEQSITILLGNLHATQVDLSGLISRAVNLVGPHLREEVLLREDAKPNQIITAEKPMYRLADRTRQLLITKRVIREQASAPFLLHATWLSFKEVQIDWPLPLIQAITITLQNPDDPAAIWPSAVAVDTRDDVALQRILMPPDSVYYVDPVMKRARTATADELHPDNATPKIRDLASGRVIRVQVMPPILSNKYGQDFKEYVALKNSVAAFVVWLVTTLGGLALKNPWAKPNPA
jgi:hypothetical protein